MPACALLVALLATLWLPTAHAADNDAPFRSSAAATGSFVSGNLSQAQAMGSLNLSKSADKAGFDVLGSAFRMWIRPAPDAPFVRIGDTLAATALPFYYLGEKPFLLGFVRYERSQLRGVTARVNGGPSIGITPIRKTERLMRISLGAQVEQTWYASPDLQPDWVADAPDRLVPRAALLSNGWARIPDPLERPLCGRALREPAAAHRPALVPRRLLRSADRRAPRPPRLRQRPARRGQPRRRAPHRPAHHGRPVLVYAPSETGRLIAGAAAGGRP